jgi:hypothetical protein
VSALEGSLSPVKAKPEELPSFTVRVAGKLASGHVLDRDRLRVLGARAAVIVTHLTT